MFISYIINMSDFSNLKTYVLAIEKQGLHYCPLLFISYRNFRYEFLFFCACLWIQSFGTICSTGSSSVTLTPDSAAFVFRNS